MTNRPIDRNRRFKGFVCAALSPAYLTEPWTSGYESPAHSRSQRLGVAPETQEETCGNQSIGANFRAKLFSIGFLGNLRKACRSQRPRIAQVGRRLQINGLTVCPEQERQAAQCLCGVLSCLFCSGPWPTLPPCRLDFHPQGCQPSVLQTPAHMVWQSPRFGRSTCQRLALATRCRQ